MAIGMIELQGGIQRTQDYTALKHQENMKPTVDQAQFQIQTDKKLDQKLNQVVRGENADKSENQADAKEKGKGQYAGDGGAKRKEQKIPQEGKVVLKGVSHFDMSV
ncbi:MAG: hypothetical protein ACI4AA_05045 [Lachnospiraceae bacterium]